MIENIGVDIIENDRFLEYIDNDRMLEKILSEKERDFLKTIANEKRKLEFIASRFAAKEALFKSGFRFAFNNVSILNNEDGSPYVIWDLNKKVLISISHNKTMSIAVVLAVEPCFEKP